MRKLNKRKIRCLIDYKETIEQIRNPFDSDLFFEMMDVDASFRELQNTGSFSPEQVLTYTKWHLQDAEILSLIKCSPEQLETNKRHIVNEIHNLYKKRMRNPQNRYI